MTRAVQGCGRMLWSLALTAFLLCVQHASAFLPSFPGSAHWPNQRLNALSSRGAFRSLPVLRRHSAVVPVTKLRASMSEDEAPAPTREDVSATESNSQSASQSQGVTFRQGDAQVFLEMAKEEEAQGNRTGAETLRSMAGKLENIMSKVEGSSPQASPPAESRKDDEPVCWPFVHPSLSASGNDLKKTGSDSMPSAARTRNAFSPGELVTWTVKVEERSGPMAIGLTSLMVDLNSDWSDPSNANKAFFMTQSGTLYNGDQVLVQTGREINAGDVVEMTLDGDAIYISVNGDELPGTIKPVTGSLRFSVSFRGTGDRVTLLSEEVREYTSSSEDSVSYGTATLSKSSIDDADDEALLSGILESKQPAAAREGVKQPKASPWKMEVDQASQAVYYWNTETKETTWERPAGFVGGTETAFLDEEKKAGRLLQKADEDKSSVMWNNADASVDSHKAVQFDADGFPVVDKFVYVDEVTCIGCTNCATVARSTFYMNSEHGRARAFRQGGDSEDVITEAVATCPVDCIWYVSWDDLVTLEQERRDQVINPYQRLVGGNFIESSQNQRLFGRQSGSGGSKASIMNSGKMRCNNCPGRGCKECPLYGVGENPEFMRKKAARERRRKMRREARMDGGAGGKSLRLSDDGFSNEEGVLDSINTWTDDSSSSFTDSSDWTPTSELTQDSDNK